MTHLDLVNVGPSFRHEDLLSRASALSNIEEMSLLLHPPDAENGIFSMMVTSFSDESGDKHSFAISALLGYLPEFIELERQWDLKLKEYRLPEFHAAKCEEPREPFETYQRAQRDLFQREFYALLAQKQIWGYCTAVWLPDYQGRWAEFESLRSLPEGTSPTHIF